MLKWNRSINYLYAEPELGAKYVIYDDAPFETLVFILGRAAAEEIARDTDRDRLQMLAEIDYERRSAHGRVV